MSKSSGERKMTTGDVAKATGDGVTKLLIIDKVVYDVTNYTNR
jgi:cytochrome b involved in lipid metabolism